MTRSRGLRDGAVRALAKVATVWAIAVLGFLFIATATAASDEPTSAASTTTNLATTADAPSAAGLALIVTVLAAGALVLAIGCMRTKVAKTGRPAPTAEPTYHRTASVGLGLAA